MIAADFLERYPEFEPAGDLVDAVLAEQASSIDRAVFGSSWDTAHGLLTADALWNSPFGVTLRLDSADSAKSDYMVRYEELEKAITVPLKMMVL